VPQAAIAEAIIDFASAGARRMSGAPAAQPPEPVT
jgi:hypothetical protein